MKKIINIFPELYFIAMGAYWVIENYSGNGKINYIAILASWLMFLQIIYKNKILGLIYSNLLAATSVYMIFSIFSEVVQFNSIAGDAASLMSYGIVIFSVGLVMSMAMLYKFATAKSDYDDSVLTVTY